MLDDELREQLASWVRPVTSLPVPDIRVLRRRARRRVMGRTATAAAIIAVVAAAAVGLVSGLPGTGRPAGGRPVTGATNPATPSCTGTCVDLFFTQEFGHHHSPNFILDVYQQHARIGQPIILHRASTNDPAEDFRAVDLGTVAGFYAAGRVSAAFALHYGCVAADSTAPLPGRATSPTASGSQPSPMAIRRRPGYAKLRLAARLSSTTRRSRSSTRPTAGTAACASAWRAPRCRRRA